MVCGGGAREHEDTGADDAADAEQCQMCGVQRAPQLVTGRLLLLQDRNGLGREELAHREAPILREGLYISDPWKATEQHARRASAPEKQAQTIRKERERSSYVSLLAGAVAETNESDRPTSDIRDPGSESR